MTVQLGAFSREQLNIGLPPRDVWLHSPEKDGLIPTPRDDRGLVDVPLLIDTLKATVDPAYDWLSGFSDDHHEYWPKADYVNDPMMYANPHEFRNQMSNRLDGPCVFHRWLHRVTEPPVMPSQEVMHYCIKAERAMGSLAVHISSTKWLMKKSGLPKSHVHEGVNRRLDNFIRELDKVKELPPEFQPIDLSDYRADDLEGMLRLERTIGRRSLKLAIASPDLQRVA